MVGDCRWTGRGCEQVWVGKMSEAGGTSVCTILEIAFFRVEQFGKLRLRYRRWKAGGVYVTKQVGVCDC